MPKLKTNKTARGRFKITGTGKVLRSRQGRGHLRRTKSSRVKHQLDRMHPVTNSEARSVKRMLPYGA